MVAYLRSRGLHVLDVKERGWQRRSDEDILEAASWQGRVILTHDGDFGTIALLGRRQVVGIVRIHPGHIRHEMTIDTIERLLGQGLALASPLLVVVQGSLVRVHNCS